MNVLDDKAIEQIVRNVMGKLGASATGVSSDVTDLPVPWSAEVERSGSSPVVLTEKVITQELLERRLQNARQLVLGPTSILTPSARDFLRSRHVECNRQAAGQSTGRQKSRWKAIVVQSNSALSRVLNDLQESDRSGWCRESADCTNSAVKAALSALGGAEVDGVVVFAGQGALVACLANRDGQVRAAVVNDVSSINQAKSLMGANLVVVNAAGKSYYELRSLLRTLVDGDAPRPPAGWME